MVHHAIQYISLATLDYRSVWWRLFHVPTSSEWSNVLLLVELLFSLPSSNGKVERVFSQLNNIKTNKRTRLGSETLDDLLGLATEQIPLSKLARTVALTFGGAAKLDAPIRNKGHIMANAAQIKHQTRKKILTMTLLS